MNLTGPDASLMKNVFLTSDSYPLHNLLTNIAAIAAG